MSPASPGGRRSHEARGGMGALSHRRARNRLSRAIALRRGHPAQLSAGRSDSYLPQARRAELLLKEWPLGRVSKDAASPCVASILDACSASSSQDEVSISRQALPLSGRTVSSPNAHLATDPACALLGTSGTFCMGR